MEKCIEIRTDGGNIVKVFAETFEYEAFNQIKAMANYEPYLDSKIRVMPDAHAGKGCTVGTTITIKDKVTPNLVGVDIGCGMLCVNLGKVDFCLADLDVIIGNFIPSGFSIRNKAYKLDIDLGKLKCSRLIDLSRAVLSIGTLGGGNHFIEVDVDKQGNKYLVIHSGSRNLGVQVCKYYQDKAYSLQNEVSTGINAIIEKLKKEGRQKEIEKAIKSFKKPQRNKELAYVEGILFDDYLHDMDIVQRYADANRKAISDIILKELNVKPIDSFTTVHNYIDIKSMILRKGAVSAQYGEKLIIPMNMRDGSLICIGKGNPDWNYSAPHGAGRLMSRSKAKEQISIDEFEKSMEGVFTTSVLPSTIDESPMAYKPMDEIIRCIDPTVEIIEIIKPVYNFKAS